MKINFYNYFHNGDIHVSRNFIKYIIEKFPQYEYIYYHNNSNKILFDIPIEIKPIKNSLFFKQEHMFNLHFILNDEKFINTWYKANNNFYINQTGVSIQTLHSIFKQHIKNIFNSDIEDNIIYFLPDINFNKLNHSIIDEYLKNYNNIKILICNNDVKSNQIENFDFNPAIKLLANKYKNILFFVTNLTKNIIILPNVIYIEKIFNFGENNLNEISYFSTFCNILIGRYSGPMTFSYIKENMLNTKKIIINFMTPQHGDGSFGISKILDKNTYAKFITFNEFNVDKLNKIIGDVL